MQSECTVLKEKKLTEKILIFLKKNQSIVYLQCCVNFCYMAKCSVIYIYIYILFHILSIMVYHFFFRNYIGVQFNFNVVLVSDVQQSESVIHISTCFQILFPYRPLKTSKQSSLWYIVGPCCLSILYIIACIC